MTCCATEANKKSRHVVQPKLIEKKSSQTRCANITCKNNKTCQREHHQSNRSPTQCRISGCLFNLCFFLKTVIYRNIVVYFQIASVVFGPAAIIDLPHCGNQPHNSRKGSNDERAIRHKYFTTKNIREETFNQSNLTSSSKTGIYILADTKFKAS